jgi:hypothetical protein
MYDDEKVRDEQRLDRLNGRAPVPFIFCDVCVMVIATCSSEELSRNKRVQNVDATSLPVF